MNLDANSIMKNNLFRIAALGFFTAVAVAFAGEAKAVTVEENQCCRTDLVAGCNYVCSTTTVGETSSSVAYTTDGTTGHPCSTLTANNQAATGQNCCSWRQVCGSIQSFLHVGRCPADAVPDSTEDRYVPQCMVGVFARGAERIPCN